MTPKLKGDGHVFLFDVRNVKSIQIAFARGNERNLRVGHPRFMVLFSSFESILNEGKQSFKGTLVYKDSNGKTYQENIDYNLTPLFQRKYMIYPDIQSSVKNLTDSCQKLSRQLEQLTY